MKRRVILWSSILAVVLAAWFGTKAWQAHKNLVTLDVRGVAVRDVLRKCEWQTWETIVVHKDVKGTVTLNVRNMPLEEALGIISDQVSARASAVYPIYSQRSAVVNLRKLARGDISHESAGWTNYASGSGDRGGRGGRGGGPGGGGGFGQQMMPQDAPITVNIPAKDLDFAALALSRRGNVQVVPQDGLTGMVTVNLTETAFADCVAKLASSAGRKWDVFYTFEARPDFFADRGDRGDRDREGEGLSERGFGRRGTNDTNRISRTEGDTNWMARAEARRDDRDLQRQRETEARLATMTPAEQAQEKQRQETFEQMRQMTPEQRSQAFQEMQNRPEFAQERARMESRMNNAFKYASPEQRVERTKRINEMRKRREQGGR